MADPKISVVMTSYNGGKYIAKQLDSIIVQSLVPDEIVICDDCSTDETRDILKRYELYDNIRIYNNSSQLGVVKNFQKGCSLAKQDNWIAFADQDDIWEPQKLYQLSEKMKTIDDGLTPALVYSDLSVIDSNDVVISRSFWERQKITIEHVNLPVILFGNAVTGCTMLINYSMKSEFLKMNHANFLHDEWLALIAYSFGRKEILHDPLVRYRQHATNVTYSEEYKVPNFFNTFLAEIDFVTGKKKFLDRQTELAKAFFGQYRFCLDARDQKVFEHFISLEKKHYFRQRLSRLFTRLASQNGQNR